jgi:outer membrane protein assembly factor BamB
VVIGSLHAAESGPIELAPDTLITKWRVAGPIKDAADGEVLKQDLNRQEELTIDGKQYPIRSLKVNAKRTVGVGIVSAVPLWRDEADLVSFPSNDGAFYAQTVVSSDRARPISLVIMVSGPFRLWFNGQALDLGNLTDNPKQIDILPYDQPNDTMFQNFLTVTGQAQAGVNTVLVRLDPLQRKAGGRQSEESAITPGLGLRLNCEPPVVAAVPKGVLGADDFYPSAEHPVCDRGDGTGIFPGARPPAFWDEKRGLNIRWRSDLPGPGKCGPIVVGDKVFTLAEPNVLVCCDTGTGRILWQQASDQLDLFPPAEAEEARREWAELRGAYRRLFELSGEYGWLSGQGAQIARGYLPDTPLNDSPELKQRLAELQTRLQAEFGWPAFDKISSGGHGPQIYADKQRLDDYKCRMGAIFRNYGFHIEKTTHWQWRGYCDATPCSDGSYVYATFGTGQTVCYDLDGNRRWMVWSPLCRENDPAYQAIFWHYACSVDPYLTGDLLITQIGNYIRALDKHSGKTVWEQHIKYGITSMNGTCCGQARPMRLADTTVLISPDGRVYRLSDGKILLDPDGWKAITGRTDDVIPATGKKDRRSVWNAVSAGTPAINGDIAHFAFPNGIRALQYSLAGEQVTVRQLWTYELPDERISVRKKGDQEQAAARSFSHEPAVFFDASPLYDPVTERIWFGLHKTGEIEIVDARTGTAIQEGCTTYSLGEGKGCAVAGNLVFAHWTHGITDVYARTGGLTPVAENEVRLPLIRDLRDRNMTWAEYKEKWFDRGFEKISVDRTTGELFFHDDAIYMRTDTSLVCIGSGT